MSYGSNTSWERQNTSTPSFQPHNHGNSVMRDFLESSEVFEWPKALGECLGNHCDISRDIRGIPLKWKRIISDKKNASIDMYEAGPDFRFQKTFVVKTIRGIDIQEAWKTTANEVKNMKDLRHPHVAALLATFTYQARLSILIFPAACCDLHQFMERISIGFEKDRVASPSDVTSTIDDYTTSSRYSWDLIVGSASKHKEHDLQEVPREHWPLTKPMDEMIKMLRGYFVCLSQALSYLHISGVRHKDIKPGNILIDESGSVILTDFGISRRFPKHTPHVTNDEWKFTRKYASPEIMKDRDTFRDDSSDVFSLGCVFLEMATLLLGKNLNDLSNHYAITINDSSKEEAYHCNLGGVHSWIEYLGASRELKLVQEHWLPRATDETNLSPDDLIIVALVDIRKMLDEVPSSRPVSRELWQRFQDVSAIKCRDCDPRRSDMWEPSAKQLRDADTGLNIRKQQKYNSHGHTKTRPELEFPTLQQNGDVSESTRVVRSPSPKLHIVQEPESFRDETNPGITQASTITSPARIIHKSTTDNECQNSGSVKPAPTLQLSRPKATKLEISEQRAIRQDQQSQGPNQRRASRGVKSTSELTEYIPRPQTRIIVYDLSRTIAFDTIYAFLKDHEFKEYPLPRFRQRVEIGDKADLIAKVDLRQLKLGTKWRRWMGGLRLIYVLNYAAQQPQTGKILDPGG